MTGNNRPLNDDYYRNDGNDENHGGGSDGGSSPTPLRRPEVEDLYSFNRQTTGLSKQAPNYHYKKEDYTRFLSPELQRYWRLYRAEAIYYGGWGGQRQRGEFDQNWDKWAKSELITRYERHGIHPLLTTAATTPDPTGDINGIHFLQIFNTTIIGAGGDNDVCLFKETSATNPVIAAITGSSTAGRPGADIVGMADLAFNGSTARKGVLFLDSAKPIAFTDTSGTLHGTTAHNDLSGATCAIQTFTNDNRIYFTVGGDLVYLGQSSDWDTAPGTTGTKMRTGTAALGLLARGGGDVRLYFQEPDIDDADGPYQFGAEGTHRVVHVDLDGVDKQVLDFGSLGKNLTWSAIYRDGIVGISDDQTVMWENAANLVNFEIFEDEEANSNRDYRTRGGWVIGDDLYIRVERFASTNGTGDTEWCIRYFDFDNFRWHQETPWFDYSSTSTYGVMSPGSLPWSEETHFMHHYADGSWYRKQFPLPGTNPFTLRHTSGAEDSTGAEFEATATWSSTLAEWPGLEGMMKQPASVTFMGDGAAAGVESGASTEAYIDITFCGVTRRIQYATSTWADFSQPVSMQDGAHMVDKVQLEISSQRQVGATNSTRHTPNVFPIKAVLWAWEPIEEVPTVPPEGPFR